MADTELRQRKAASAAGDSKPVKSKSKSKSKRRGGGDDYTPWVDILRVLSFLFVASCGLSYVVSGGESFFWGMKNKPNYLRVDWWKSQLTGPIELTEQQLLAYDGRDAQKPLYLAINGTIYDVSNGRRMYGPGGSYSAFAGRDAARGFVTGCFAEDRTADLRGVEEMFLPIEDPEVDKYWTTAEMEKLRAEELANAKERAHAALKHWVDFFANSKKYTKVGYMKREEGWLEKLPRRELCAQAQKGRSKRRRNQD
ncbi:hypothetical protein QQS21_005894 [Conoideocrella luteorostrata]|uniref:Cytochrome b5 heme-binding domain-containing protein n=1 Tax=Conoideocrella luteorostrata TaxID=1105319 RepID=A0AAJ0CNS3_9HYPO|nr:hypothetical protein QQS21_005894 [Conoideocrella luteorostrata]